MSPSETAEAVFSLLQAINPEPETELYSTNPYTLLVAIVLSAQSTDAGVNKATPALFAVADTPYRMVELGEERLKTYISTIGLFNTKARNIIALSHKLITEFNAQIPHSLAELQSLPGVGNKTANVWLNCALGMPTIAVDTHVLRVSNRLGLVHASNPDKCQADLEQRVPAHYKQHAHHWLILHGRYICKARKPECGRCPIAHLCPFPEKT